MDFTAISGHIAMQRTLKTKQFYSLTSRVQTVEIMCLGIATGTRSFCLYFQERKKNVSTLVYTLI